MKVGRYYIGKQELGVSAAGLGLAAAVGSVAWLAIDVASDGPQQASRIKAEALAPEYDYSSPDKLASPVCTGALGEIASIGTGTKSSNTEDANLVRSVMILPQNTMAEGNPGCASIHNPDNVAEVYSNIIAGDTFTACQVDKTDRINVYLPSTGGHVVGSITTLPNLEVQDGGLASCKEIGWDLKPGIYPDANLDIPYYDPNLDSSNAPEVSDCYIDVYQNYKWSDPACVAALQNNY